MQLGLQHGACRVAHDRAAGSVGQLDQLRPRQDLGLEFRQLASFRDFLFERPVKLGWR